MSDYVSATRNRALRLLAEHPDGCTGAVLMAHGFSLELLNELIGAGLATASTESVTRGSKPVEILLVKVTEAGRRALE